MKTHRLPEGARRRAAGFSLIEVTIALGITAVALVSLMGMIPQGMKTLRRAADKAIEGRIHQQVLGELQLTAWEATGGGASPIDSFHKQIRYYDDQGIQIAEEDLGGESNPGGTNHTYTARIHVPKSGDTLPPSVGGHTHMGVMDTTGQPILYLRLVIVEITSIADPRFLENPRTSFDDPQYFKHIRTFRTTIAKMGQEYDPNDDSGS